MMLPQCEKSGAPSVLSNSSLDEDITDIALHQIRNSNKETMGSIDLYTTSILLRYISEWDPRENAHTKGGYLDGEIRVPNTKGTLIMRIQTYPAADIEESVLELHPCLLHLVRMGKGKRDQGKEPVPTHYHWMQTFIIQDGMVKIVNQMSELDIINGCPRNVPKVDIVTELQGNTIVMGRKKGELNLIILQPKQRNRAKNNEEATLTTVLANRMNLDVNDSKVEAVEKLFKGKNSKNLKRIRLRVDFTNLQNETIGFPAISLQTVIDTGSKEIGSLDFYDASPHKSCVKGGRKIIMISEYKLSKDVAPVFQVFDKDECLRNDMEVYVKQPEKVNIKNQIIIFITPEQKQLDSIRNLIGNFTLRLRGHRAGDHYLSDKYFKFTYVDHEESGHCLFCDFEIDSDEMVQIETGVNRAKPRQPKRVMNRTGQEGQLKRARLASFDQTWDEQLMKSSPSSYGSPLSTPNHPLSPHQQNIIDMSGDRDNHGSPQSTYHPLRNLHEQSTSDMSGERDRALSSNSVHPPLSRNQQREDRDSGLDTSSVESDTQLVDYLVSLDEKESVMRSVSRMFETNDEFTDLNSVRKVLGIEPASNVIKGINIHDDNVINEDIEFDVQIVDSDRLLTKIQPNIENLMYTQHNSHVMGRNELIPCTVMNSGDDPMMPYGSMSDAKGVPVNLQRRGTIQTDRAGKREKRNSVNDFQGENIVIDEGNSGAVKVIQNQDQPIKEEQLLDDDDSHSNEETNIEKQDDSFMEEMPFLMLVFIFSFFILQMISDFLFPLSIFPTVIISLACSVICVKIKTNNDLSS